MTAAALSAMRGAMPATAVPLVLLPGTLCDARLFAPLLERLPPRDVHFMPLDGGNTAGAIADRVLAQAPARFALLGFSLGGIVALEIAARASERLLGLALVGSSARGVPSSEQPARRAAWEVDGRLDEHVRTQLWPLYVGDDACRDEGLRERIAEMAEAIGHARLTDQVAVMATRVDSRPRLGALDVPALVLAGAEDRLCPPFLQHELASHLAGATLALALVPGAGHFVPMEAPDETAAHVAAWLMRVDAAASPQESCYLSKTNQERS